jgi:signal transduction histidine kinase
VFALAVMGPSLVLAWLALGSLRDQQLAQERQRGLLYQGVADAIARELQAQLAEQRREFGLIVDKLLGRGSPAELAGTFDDAIRSLWPLAEVGFAVTLSGVMCNPTMLGRPEARRFRLENDGFLSSREPVEVIWQGPKGKAVNLTALDQAGAGAARPGEAKEVFATKSGGSKQRVPDADIQFSSIVGDAREGTLARFLHNRLNLLLWYRSEIDPNYVFGAQIDVPRLLEAARPRLHVEAALAREIVAVLRDDNGQPVARSAGSAPPAGARAAATAELGEMLPHWEVAVFVTDPTRWTETARVTRLALGLLVALLVLVLGVGSWLIVADLRRQLALARQKTDFVGNVSHELKTPLTSIRMFAEMLAEGRVREPEKQRQFYQIISAEAARLTRLLNTVLDFARLERGEKQLAFAPCDLVEVVRETCETYRPHLEALGFALPCDLPPAPVMIQGDRDALAQVLVNLLSNAEKYSGAGRDIEVRLRLHPRAESPGAAAVQGARATNPRVEISVLDRGPGVPGGCEERIFEQFFRAHDSLASGIQGSGLGLTLARQIARRHHGDVRYAPRDGGGSCFTLWLPATA